ncbi:hypothetical protein BU24DRAFT_397981 [Aaosphaeria arxii CBS 175.79]|uniref:BZIP transcription factor n=1 Tax=Aaosphaeria arxii CBS 175.79 TaxID=1450172 RepID=A0A6A5XF22_9PLEO|nr:uncharacterized protein BU24DRAFT_397981 [Aaosphaeria arxii CBS 175.79]KAF2011451.1 hypothetical protein BU24DRAFT_397981 [Aaosphaeria arxii CBS 175.79]
MAEAEASNADAVGSDAQDSNEQPAQKKRRTGASSRGVANLTPDQLARKRANDREAQRAIRERTKNQIDRLNQRIRELESQQPYHDLQVVLREKEAIQAENTEIRKRLESVVSIIQPLLRASGGLNELAAAAERSPLPPPVAPSPRDVSQPHEPTPHNKESRSYSHNSNHRDLASPDNGVQSPAIPEPGRQWMYTAYTPSGQRWSVESAHYEQARTTPGQQQQQHGLPFDERLGVDFLLDNNQRRVDTGLPPPANPPAQESAPSANAPHHTGGQCAPTFVPYQILPRNVPPTCPLDVIMLDFLNDRQARAAEGVPLKTLVGPMYPNFTSLVYPDRCVDSHPLSKLFTDILRTFPDICGIPEQVAIVFIMFLIMRWQIEPSQENYDRIPDWVSPRPSQLFVSHPAWFDHIPWPRLRDRLIAHSPFVLFDQFFIPFTTTISLNWPYEARDCLLPASKIHSSSLSTTSSIPASSPYSTAVHAGSPHPSTPQPAGSTPGANGSTHVPKEDDQWLINPAFESHLRDIKNWSLGPDFRNTFPSFSDCVRIKESR